MKRLVFSFYYAFRGIVRLTETERNFRIHLAAMAAAICLGFYAGLSAEEWISVIMVSCLVLGAEAFNSAIEKLADHLHPERHDSVARVKDMAAAGVLIATAAAVITGLIVFVPKFV